MASQVIPFPHPASRPAPIGRQISIDGEFYDDDVPPELFDRDEDIEELSFYVHMAELAHDE